MPLTVSFIAMPIKHYFAVLYIIALVTAPWVAEWLPITRPGTARKGDNAA
jgi:hypothetical protein